MFGLFKKEEVKTPKYQNKAYILDLSAGVYVIEIVVLDVNKKEDLPSNIPKFSFSFSVMTPNLIEAKGIAVEVVKNFKWGSSRVLADNIITGDVYE